MATFREDYQRALALVEETALLCDDDAEVLEPAGPEPWPEGWRLSFARGTLALLLGRVNDAVTALRRAERIRPSAEGANNLAVALRRAGHRGAAAPYLRAAMERRPDYADARSNMASENAFHVTTHPLRVHATRTDYAPRVVSAR
jgi:tetratricopeptide (TPR) repeat protein